MSDANYGSFSIDELIKQFERSCLMQYETDITGDIDIFNHEYQTLVDITNELQVRGHLARRELVRLFNNTNKQVRLQAAKFVYPVARPEATNCLQDLAGEPFSDPQVFDARMTLRRLEEVPDCLDH